MVVNNNAQKLFIFAKFATLKIFALLTHTHMHACTYTHNAFYYSHTQTP